MPAYYNSKSRNLSNNAVMLKDGRPCGYVRQGEFVRKISPSHIIRRPVPALGYEPHVINQAKALGAKSLAVIDGAVTYRISMADFERTANLLNMGRGPQLIIPLSAWSTDAATEPPARKPKGRQLPMWGEQ